MLWYLMGSRGRVTAACTREGHGMRMRHGWTRATPVGAPTLSLSTFLARSRRRSFFLSKITLVTLGDVFEEADGAL